MPFLSLQVNFYTSTGFCRWQTLNSVHESSRDLAGHLVRQSLRVCLTYQIYTCRTIFSTVKSKKFHQTTGLCSKGICLTEMIFVWHVRRSFMNTVLSFMNTVLSFMNTEHCIKFHEHCIKSSCFVVAMFDIVHGV